MRCTAFILPAVMSLLLLTCSTAFSADLNTHRYGPESKLLIQSSEVLLAIDTIDLVIGNQNGPGSFHTPVEGGDYHLYMGALWIGGIVGADTLVSTGTDGWSRYNQELTWRASDVPSGNYYSPYLDHQATWCQYVDTITEGVDNDYFGRPHIPLNLSIRHRMHTWPDEPLAGTVMHDLLITNIGGAVIQDLCVGLFADCDITDTAYASGSEGAQDDLSGSLAAEGVVYSIDNNGDFLDGATVPKTMAVKFHYSSIAPLSTNFNWWVSNGDPSFDWGPRQRSELGFDFLTGGNGTPEGDRNKYYLMTNSEWDYDQCQTASIGPSDPIWAEPLPSLAHVWSTGLDTRYLMSYHLSNLPPDSTVRIIFSTFTGDSVHTDSTNFYNLPDDPDTYLANLGFSDMLANAAVSDSLAASLIDPLGPVQGLRHPADQSSDRYIEWDPWIADAPIDGYEVWVSQVPAVSLPHPGLLPPWFAPVTWSYHATLGQQTEYLLDDLPECSFYFVSVRQIANTQTGDTSAYVSFSPDRPDAPVFIGAYADVVDFGDPLHLQWSASQDPDVAEYRIYRLDPADTLNYWATADHAALYSTTDLDGIAPVEQFPVGDSVYYYYAMTPYTIVDAAITEFTDYDVNEGAMYMITAVDNCGVESLIASRKRVFVVDPKSREIVYLWMGCDDLAYCDSLLSAAERLLLGFDADFYSYTDTLLHRDIDWHEFMKYRTVVVDGALSAGVEFHSLHRETEFLLKCFQSGGKVVLFGAPAGWFELEYDTDPAWYSFLTEPDPLLGIDSIYLVGAAAGLDGTPVDSLYGFQMAERIDTALSDLDYDPNHGCFTSIVEDMFWSPNTPPSVACYRLSDSAEVVCAFRSLYPSQCVLEGLPVGIRHRAEWYGYAEVDIALYGFHPWYMELDDMRDLLARECECESTCCRGIRGNVDADPQELINIVDMTYLVAYLFSGGAAPACEAEADFDADGAVNIVDMTALVGYLFNGGPPPADCPW